MKLTDRMVRSLERPPTGNRIVYDSELRGLGCRITANGAVSFVFNYRVRATGQERRFTIGPWPAWSIAGAREKAKELRRRVDDGGDPLGELALERGAPTVAELAQRFLAEHVAKLRPHTRQDYESAIRNDIVPTLGKLKVARVEFENIERLHAKISERAPIAANRAYAVVSKMFALAVRWKMRPDSPCRGVQRNPEHQRRRYLTPAELRRLMQTLAEYSHQPAAEAVRMLLLTGARLGEVLGARFEQFEGDVWVKPPSSTKQKREHRAPLNAPARQLLDRLRRKSSSPWLFPGRGDGHVVDLKSHWPRICRAANIHGLRIHDLRHSYASQLASAGVGLHVIGGLLGHSSPATTYRYAHLFDDPLRQATEKVGAVIIGKPAAKILPIKGGRRQQ